MKKNIYKNLFSIAIISAAIMLPVFNVAQAGSGNPSVEARLNTLSAVSITTHSAKLNGEIISTGGSSVEVWFEYGKDQNLNDSDSTAHQSFSNPASFNESISGLNSGTTYYFRAAAKNGFGLSYGQILSFKTKNVSSGGSGGGGSSTPPIPPVALTSLASGVGLGSATLNGVIENNSSGSASAWFEYGTSTALGQSTASQSLGFNSSSAYNQYITGLQTDTMYYFRAVAQTSGGTSYGEMKIFKTGGTVVIDQTPIPTPHASTGSSFVMLKIEDKTDAVFAGDTIDYTITYKNIGSKTLNKVIVETVFPQEISYKQSNNGIFDSKTNTLTANVGTLAPNESGIITIQAKVSSSAKNKDFILTNAAMKYTNPNTTAQEEAIAYVLNSVSKNSNSLAAASIFGDGSFLPTTLVGWLTLALIIFFLIIIGRKLYSKAV